MATYMRGTASTYGSPIDLTCPTAKRAWLFAGASLVIAVAALIWAGARR